MQSPELSDTLARVRRIEAKRQKADASGVADMSGGLVFVNEVLLVQDTATGDVPWTMLDVGRYVPKGARSARLFVATLDTAGGTSLNYIRFRSHDVVLTGIVQRGSSTGDTQNIVNVLDVPLSGGRFEYQVDLDGATSFLYAIALQGYTV